MSNETELCDVVDELTQLRDLFQRRLLDDKAKNKTIADLMARLNGQALSPMMREFALLLDRIEGYLVENEAESPHDFVCSVYEEILSILQHHGLEQIETSYRYDCATQKVFSVVETDEVPNAHVVEVVRRGYRLNGTLLRPEEVVIAKSFGEGLTDA